MILTVARASAAALLLLASGCRAEPQAKTAVPVAATQAVLLPLTVDTASGRRALKVEVARTPEEQAKGLMFRTALPADGGMLFPFPRPRVASFWMKNTVIPLDIIFVRGDGTIESIAANTEPYSLDPVQSGEPVTAVLELAGGRAAELGIEPGDRVDWAR